MPRRIVAWLAAFPFLDMAARALASHSIMGRSTPRAGRIKLLNGGKICRVAVIGYLSYSGVDRGGAG